MSEGVVLTDSPNRNNREELRMGDAMVAFRHRLTVAGYSVLVNELFSAEGGAIARRACNVLIGRVASDRPCPTVEDWYAAARIVKESQCNSDEEGFREIPVLESLLSVETTGDIECISPNSRADDFDRSAWDAAEAAYMMSRQKATNDD